MTSSETQGQGIRRALSDMDPSATLVAHWVDAPTLPMRTPVVHAVFAYPSQRLATLRHWRDTLEVDVGGTPLVAHEASKWARLLLKGHAGTKAICVHPVSAQSAGLGTALAGIATRIEGADIDAWRDAAGWEPLPRHPNPLKTGPERFEALEGWLVSVRQEVDRITAPSRTGALPSDA